jgi:hypothetical protein
VSLGLFLVTDNVLPNVSDRMPWIVSYGLYFYGFTHEADISSGLLKQVERIFQSKMPSRD